MEERERQLSGTAEDGIWFTRYARTVRALVESEIVRVSDSPSMQYNIIFYVEEIILPNLKTFLKILKYWRIKLLLL